LNARPAAQSPMLAVLAGLLVIKGLIELLS
jgi:hypothetical protein